MTFDDWITAVCTALEFTRTPTVGGGPTGDANFNAFYQRAIDYTENRIQRDLDLLGTVITDETATMTADSRSVTLPTDAGVFIVVTEVYPIVDDVRQAPLLPVSRAVMDALWPSEAAPNASSIPTMFCMADQASILVGPAPGQAYGIGIVGEQRVAQLGPTQSSNLLSTLFPDLYFAASMVLLCGYQRDFSAAAEDPKMAMSWEQTYQTLRDSAETEEGRKRYLKRRPSPLSAPPQA